MFFGKKKLEADLKEIEGESTEESQQEPEPIDVRAFIDEKRRHAEDEALRVANMLAEEYYGVVEPLDVPNDLGSTLFFNTARAYRVSTGTMRFTVFCKPRQDVPSYVAPIIGATEYEKSVARTKDIVNFITIHLAILIIDDKTGELHWKHNTYISGRIESENDVYKIREQFYPSW